MELTRRALAAFGLTSLAGGFASASLNRRPNTLEENLAELLDGRWESLRDRKVTVWGWRKMEVDPKPLVAFFGRHGVPLVDHVFPIGHLLTEGRSSFSRLAASVEIRPDYLTLRLGEYGYSGCYAGPVDVFTLWTAAERLSVRHEVV